MFTLQITPSQAKLLALDGLLSLFDTLPRDSVRKHLLKRLGSHLSRFSSRFGVTIILQTSVSTRLLGEDGSSTSYDSGSRAILQPSAGSKELHVEADEILIMREAIDRNEIRVWTPGLGQNHLQNVELKTLECLRSLKCD